jgi:hypothetical protein
LKHHFHLVAGEVTFRDPENPEAVGSMKLNSVQKTPKRDIAARHLGQAQQALQMRAMEKLGVIEVVDVPIICVSYLGHMTDFEFADRPEEPKPGHAVLSEKPKTTPFDA